MDKQCSVFEILSKNENKIKPQKEIVIMLWELWEDKYSQNYNYYNNYFDLVTNELFGIINFKILLNSINYDNDWNNFKIPNNLDDRFLGVLEFFYNIFYTTILLAKKEIEKLRSISDRNWVFSSKFKVLQDFLKELTKFFDWNGYTLIKYDNQINKDSDYKEYHLVKKEMVGVIESLPVEKDLKTLLLELSQESLERKDLENYLNILYINYLENEQDQIKQYLGNKMHSNIFNLFNNGLIKHKDSENLNKISQFTEQEKLNALKWLKDIVLVYFAVSRNGNDYPEKIINFKHKNNAN